MTKLQRFQVNQPFSASAIVVAFGHRKCIECIYTPQENNNKIIKGAHEANVLKWSLDFGGSKI